MGQRYCFTYRKYDLTLRHLLSAPDAPRAVSVTPCQPCGDSLHATALQTTGIRELPVAISNAALELVGIKPMPFAAHCIYYSPFTIYHSHVSAPVAQLHRALAS